MRNPIFGPWWSLYPDDNDHFFNLPCWEALRGLRKMMEERKKEGKAEQGEDDLSLGEGLSLYSEWYKKYIDGKEVESKEKEVVNGEVVKDIHTTTALPNDTKPNVEKKEESAPKSRLKEPTIDDVRQCYNRAREKFLGRKDEEEKRKARLECLESQNKDLIKKVEKLEVVNARLNVEIEDLRKFRAEMKKMAELFNKL
ncbi:MAG: hypothetical protein LUD72_09370 [Bacteroidales bacterium]|nr:hypothetical protein [Bacteroidales bacterium]